MTSTCLIISFDFSLFNTIVLVTSRLIKLCLGPRRLCHCLCFALGRLGQAAAVPPVELILRAGRLQLQVRQRPTKLHNQASEQPNHNQASEPSSKRTTHTQSGKRSAPHNHASEPPTHNQASEPLKHNQANEPPTRHAGIGFP